MKETLQKEYQLRFSPIKGYRFGVWKVLAEDFFQKLIPQDCHILDLGCGWGEFINNIKAKAKYGMDLNPDAKNHLESSVKFINQDCSSQWQLADNSLDVVFTSNFLEHLPSKDHIEKTIAEARRCLEPGGKIICVGPNIKHLGGLYWDFWDHRIALTEATLSEILKMHDFKIEKCLAKFLPYTMVNKKPAPLAFVKLYLKIPLMWKVFGKQFLVIATKSS